MPHMGDPRRTLTDQMVVDWAAIGLRRLEHHLARHAEFCDFLRRRRDNEDREHPSPPRRPR